MRVLIVDDHPSFRATARALLEAEGFDVIGEAVDGASARGHLPAAAPAARPARRPAAGQGRLHGLRGAPLQRSAPDVVLTSSRDSCDYGALIGRSGARGFVPKAELSGAALAALLPES